MTEDDKREMLAWCNTIKSSLNSLQFAAPENHYLFYNQIKEAEANIRRLLGHVPPRMLTAGTEKQ